MEGEPVLVLLVEDNVDHAELVIRTLEDHHIANKIKHVVDGQAALDYLLRRNEYEKPESSPRPHVILLDLRLPRVDGLDVLKVVKENDGLKNIPVIVLTTSEADKDMIRAYDRHVNSYLVKPVGYDDFHKLMNDLGFYWLGWNSHPNI
ncbi:MAG: response regulator [Chloroflexi bacterium]|nr:response regulator [Chloroflexota bacterium]